MQDHIDDDSKGKVRYRFVRHLPAARFPPASSSGLRRLPARRSGVVAAGTVELGTNCAPGSGAERSLPRKQGYDDHHGRGSPSSSPPPEVQETLRQQIAQALQPALAEWRQQTVRTVRQQLDQAQLAERADDRQQASPAPQPSRAEEQLPVQQGEHESRATDGTASEEAQEPPDAEPDSAPSAASEILRQAPGFLEQASTRWLRSRIEDGRDALTLGARA